MSFLAKIWKIVRLTVQFTLVFIYILFEEVIWERLAEPIYEKIQSLRLLQKLQNIVNGVDRYTLLLIFLSLLLSVEGAGLTAGFLVVKGKVLLGGLLYMIKIPIAGFTFWLFKVSKTKLLSFKWFAFAYNKMLEGMEWLKSTEIYQSSFKILLSIKENLKMVKRRYFSKNSQFLNDIKRLYYYIKKNLKNRKWK